ncbi:hypothetical protein Q1695_003929 [Nippostrongylus brasiliensis]|nr:hypothetical protein Q1695_003929 [Nippostrongylus brasiliensis]
MGLFFNILIIFSLIFVAIAVYVGASREKLIFKSYEVPIIASTYDEVAVVTNSVACNDIARMLLNQQYSTFAIAFTLQVCLMLVEPYATSPGGLSTLVYVENATCHVLDVFRSWDDLKEDKLERTPERSSFYKDYGDLKKSVAYPTEAIVMLHLFQKIPKNEKLRLVEDLQVFLKSQIPVSPTLGKHLRYTSMLHLLFDKHGLGELMEAPTWIKDMFEDEKQNTSKVEKQDTSENEKQDTSEDEKQETSEDQKRAMNVSDDVKIVMLTKSISKKLEEFTKLSHLELQGRNYSNLSEAVRKYIKRLEIDEEFNGEKVCIPTPFDSMMGRLENSFKEVQETSSMRNAYSTIFDMLLKIYTWPRIWLRHKENETLTDNKEELDHQFETQQLVMAKETDVNTLPSLYETEWASNMFVIVNRTSKTAVAYVGTLGGVFGSSIVTEKAFHLNNNKILTDITRNNTDELHLHRLLPLISYRKDGTISLAYTQSGGGVHVSTSFPRTFSTLMLRKIFPHRTMPELMSYPLAFPSVSGQFQNAYLQGVPNLRFTKTFSPKAIRNRDEAVAIENRGSKLHAAHVEMRGGYSFVPAGF